MANSNRPAKGSEWTNNKTGASIIVTNVRQFKHMAEAEVYFKDANALQMLHSPSRPLSDFLAAFTPKP